jgi:hypothetical protein
MHLLCRRSVLHHRITLVGFLAIGAFVALGAANASGATPCSSTSSSGHCYSVAVHDNTGEQNGDFATINATTLSSAHPATEFVSDELWVGTDNSNLDPNNPVGGGYFAATGLGDGESPGTGCVTQTVEFFWEDLRPGTFGDSYNCHDVSGGAKTGTAYPVSVVDAGGSSSWYINDNEVLVGESTSNPCCSLGNQGGTESADSSNHEAGSFTGLMRETTSGIVYNGWPNSTKFMSGPNMSFSWTNQDNSFKTAQNDSLPGLLRVPPALAGPAGPSPMAKALATRRATPPKLAGSQLAAIKKIVRGVAKADGVSSPTGVRVVPTTRVVAEQVGAGAGVNSNPGVYFVVLHGNFTDYAAPMPLGDPAPRGTVLELTITAKTHQITDVGLTQAAPDLHRMGVPEHLSLSKSSG